MKDNYRRWLQQQGYDQRTINTQLARVARVEQHYGSLDQSYDRDRLQGLIDQLAYSTDDERRGRPNPSKIPFVGNARNNLASYKSSVLWYARFREGGQALGSEKADLSLTNSENLAIASKPAMGLGRRNSSKPVFAVRSGARTLVDFNLDGRAALEAIIAASQYRTIAQAVASLTLFSHPETVKQTGGRALFNSVRNQRRVGQIDVYEGRRVLLDDNRSPTSAFLWANGLTRRGLDTQFNHVYPTSFDVEAYTALPNICMTPAFIAKLTDTSPEVRRLLEYRSYKLYGWVPNGQQPPEQPRDYETLEWAAPLPPVSDVRSVLELAMERKPKDRTVMAARELGWLFG